MVNFTCFVNPNRTISPTPCDKWKWIWGEVARIILTDTTIYCDEPAILTLPVVYVRGIAPPFFGVENIHRAGEHKEVLGVDDDAIPCGEFDLLGECAWLRVAPVEVEDL